MRPNSLGVLRRLRLLLVTAILGGICFGQGPVTGTPTFGSFGGGPFDTLNLGNLNVHFSIPIVSKAGRGMPFTYDLSYDSSVWYQAAVIGVTTWQPVSLYGWRGQTEVAVGYVTHATHNHQCPVKGDGNYQTYDTYVYHDMFGVPHPFIASAISDCNGGFNGDSSPPSPDGSGYSITIANDPTGVTITSASGVIKNPPSLPKGAGTATDANGNQISVNSSGVFTDTLGTSALTISGGAPNPLVFAYTSPAGTLPSYKVNYTSYNILTNFNCSGVAEFSATNVSLVSSIVLPDGSAYTFSYEANGSASTGRLRTVTLPTGGTIAYTYTGVSCTDGSTTALTRTLTPGGQWTYTRTAQGGNHWQTKVTTPPDPSTGNDTVIDFQKDSATPSTNNFYETQRVAYQGAASSTPLSSTITCYNAPTGQQPAPTNCPGAAVSSPVLRTTTFSYLPSASGVEAENDSTYDISGLVHDVYSYDLGNGVVGPLLRHTNTSYVSGMGNGIVDRPSQVTIYDGTGTLKTQSTYTYDEGAPTSTSGTPQHISIAGSRGNLTTVAAKANLSTTLYRHFSYYDTGMLSSSTAVSTSGTTNGATTTYNYAPGASSCSNSFVTSITEPLSLSRSMTWDCNGGVQTSITDENGQASTTYYTGSNFGKSADQAFWRPYAATDQASNVTTFTYLNPNQTESTMLFNNNNSVSDNLTTMDAFRRGIFSQTKQGPSATTFDTVATCYDNLGRTTFSSLPYSAAAATSATSCPGGPGKSTAYDALTRPTNVTDTGGGAISYSYTKNDVYQSIAAPAGENPKRKQFEYDSLGWLTSVCEVTGGTISWPGGLCAQITPQTGYWTRYSYDGLGNLATVTQNVQGTSQTRSFGYDMLSRPTSEVNPEAGSTSYLYDSVNTGGCVASNAGDLALKTDANGNGSCYVYDALDRVLSVGLTSGSPNSSSTPDKCFVYDSATVNGVAMGNAKVRLAEAYTTPHGAGCGGTKSTDEFFSYSARGEVTDTWESTPHSGGYYHPTAGYWANGGLKSLSIAGVPTITYGADGEGRMSNVSASTGQNPVTAASYNIFGQVTGVTLGSGDSDAFAFDSNSGRMTQYKYSVNGASEVGNLTWNSNDTLKTLAITDPFNAGNAQTCNYVHDDLSRIASSNCGSAWSQTFSYDPFGNLTESGSLSWQPGYATSTNRYALGGTSYDGDGNLLNDTWHAYGWDAVGKMTSVDSTALSYDALGRMVEQTISGAYNQIVYAPTGKRLGLFRALAVQQVYIDLPGHDLAQYASWGLSQYRHVDWLGSDRLETNTSRAVVGDNAYSPFGEPYAQTGNGEISFTGQDSKTIWPQYDFLYRQFHPQQGRWLSPDPAGLVAVDPTSPQSWNRYAYVMNDPLSYIDPDGTSDEMFEGVDGGGGSYYSGFTFHKSVWSALIDPESLLAQALLAQGSGATGGPSNSGGSGGSASVAPSNLTPQNPCLFQGKAMSPRQYAAAGAGAAALGPVPFLAISGGGFPRGSYLDAQPKASGNVFQQAAYGNYSYGVYMASAGVPYAVMMGAANTFARSSHYTAKNGPMDSTYTNLPNANVVNITNGFNAVRNGTTCHR